MAESTIVRTIHHLACTGGTIISKTLAAQPGVVMLSEVGPFVRMTFDPFDPLQQFLGKLRADASILPAISREDIERETFVRRLVAVTDLARSAGRTLVLRDHAHSDFMRKEPAAESSLLACLESAGLDTLSIVTIRDPIDSWLSTVEAGWKTPHLNPFDEYCRRVIRFVDAFAPNPYSVTRISSAIRSTRLPSFVVPLGSSSIRNSSRGSTQ